MELVYGHANQLITNSIMIAISVPDLVQSGETMLATVMTNLTQPHKPLTESVVVTHITNMKVLNH